MGKLKNFVILLDKHITSLNSSKLFAALVVITLNISSRFVTLKLSKSMENYLKFTFSRDVLIFCIAWMGCRDIYISFIISILCSFAIDYLFNEDSMFCILSEAFTLHHLHNKHNNHKKK